MDAIHPCARTTQLLVEELEDELLVYDLAADEAHRLNATAAALFRAADGTKALPELAQALSEEVGVPADEDLVLITLDHLAEAKLVEGYEPRAQDESRHSRRRFIKRAGAVSAAALGLPIVHSIVAPSAADAQFESPCPEGYEPYDTPYGPYCVPEDLPREELLERARKYAGR